VAHGDGSISVAELRCDYNPSSILPRRLLQRLSPHLPSCCRGHTDRHVAPRPSVGQPETCFRIPASISSCAPFFQITPDLGHTGQEVWFKARERARAAWEGRAAAGLSLRLPVRATSKAKGRALRRIASPIERNRCRRLTHFQQPPNRLCGRALLVLGMARPSRHS
jgi:hypothetical protein